MMSEIALRREILSIAKGRVQNDYKRSGLRGVPLMDMFNDLPSTVKNGRLEDVISICDWLLNNGSFLEVRPWVGRFNSIQLEESVRLLLFTAKAHELFLSMCKGEEYEREK